jgi:DNA-directed RNA polymerase subunit RPC12/RpoP
MSGPAHVACSNCGAPMTPAGDGRTYVCAYCKTKTVVAVEGHQIAAGMRLDFRNIDVFLGQLANTLHAGYPAATRIHAQGTYVLMIEISLDPDGFSIKREGIGVVAQHKKMVRGVALKSKVLPLEQWVELLTSALARQASSNTQAAWVLARLTGNEHDDIKR